MGTCHDSSIRFATNGGDRSLRYVVNKQPMAVSHMRVEYNTLSRCEARRCARFYMRGKGKSCTRRKILQLDQAENLLLQKPQDKQRFEQMVKEKQVIRCPQNERSTMRSTHQRGPPYTMHEHPRATTLFNSLKEYTQKNADTGGLFSGKGGAL
ncbi:uncharacterized protein LOC109720319 isoform X2 [Ananas comosus]|uniref:Uncharacterized protein LOC109720319 isoform X2 n=1 Tax=Ananas comosus TaxID=4615 RepID=A0A6P5G517_ANACO|nr:uncharacterized protein LOC109720319 isoform X2 [Ananas comosus]